MKRYWLFIVVCCVFMGCFFYRVSPVMAPLLPEDREELYASPSYAPPIYVNGTLCQFDTPAQLKNYRTMVPVRFIMEVLGGEVSWNPAENQAKVDFQDKNFVFVLNSSRVLINGKAYYLDVPAYAYRDRLYIPLRFVSEHLGASVSWNQTSQAIHIRWGSQDKVVFAYYYYKAYNELARHTDVITDLACRWYASSSQGDLYYDYQDRYADILRLTKENGIRTHLSVVLMGQKPLHTLLSNPQYRHRLVNELCSEMEQYHYDGVNIDFEFIAPADAGHYVLFLQELKAAMGADKQLSVAVFGRTAKDKWASGYDYQALGQVADRVVVMAYDYHYLNTAPGPIAPHWWVEQVADYMVSIMPAEKVLLGMPTYGYDWGQGVSCKSISASRLNDIRHKYSLQQYWDHTSMSPYYRYTDSAGRGHEVWFENAKSLQVKTEIAQRYQLGGVSFWRVGAGFEDIYQVMAAYRNHQAIQ